MKKILTLIVLFSLSLLAKENQYIGLIAFANQSFMSQNIAIYNGAKTNESLDPLLYGAKINLGVVANGGIRSVFTYSISKFNSAVFNKASEQGSDNFIHEFGFEVIKSMKPKDSFDPFFMVGFEYGFTRIDGYVQDDANVFSLKAGSGIFYRMGAFELQTTVYYKWRNWGNYNLDQAQTTNVTLSDHNIYVELGINFHY